MWYWDRLILRCRGVGSWRGRRPFVVAESALECFILEILTPRRKVFVEVYRRSTGTRDLEGAAYDRVTTMHRTG